MRIAAIGLAFAGNVAHSTDSWAESDFNGALEAILAPTSDAQFTKKRPASIAKRRAWRYDYSVEQAHSVWHLSYLSAGRMVTWEPAFGGTIWIDQETSRVLSFEMAARNLLESFPMTKVEWTMNYDFVKVGDGNFLLRKHSEADGEAERNLPHPICCRILTVPE